MQIDGNILNAIVALVSFIGVVGILLYLIADIFFGKGDK
jgi:phage shock protein PspC (stress-responsive transcriptional regulator)